MQPIQNREIEKLSNLPLLFMGDGSIIRLSNKKGVKDMFNMDLGLCHDAQIRSFKSMGQTLNKLDEAHAAYHAYLGHL